MATERVITPRPYVYGTLTKDSKRQAFVYVNDDVYTVEGVSRYYIGRDGLSVAIHKEGEKAAVIRIVWSSDSNRVILYRTGRKPMITRGVRFSIEENGHTVIVGE